MTDDMTSIEIDIAVYKRIESARTNFSETPNDVLRRLLKLERAVEPTHPTHPEPETQPDTRPQPHGKAWSAQGVILPHGTEIRMKYLRQSYAGSICDGVWVVGAVRTTSPSTAASHLAVAKAGHHPSLNGWLYWEVKKPGSERWVSLNALRQRNPPRRKTRRYSSRSSSD